jgi:hypothetical protein
MSWMVLRTDTSALWCAASSLLFGPGILVGLVVKQARLSHRDLRHQDADYNRGKAGYWFACSF